MIELLMGGALLVIGTLGLVPLVVGSIATNNRNKLDSAQTMLATSVVEQINSTIIGIGTSSLVDCAVVNHTIETGPGGANLNGSSIDFTENIAADPSKNNYHMDYVLNAPCASTGAPQGTYDVRWHIDIVGAPSTPTTTYLLTVGAKMKGHPTGNLFFSPPLTVRAMSGN
jgi:hypothetical protein